VEFESRKEMCLQHILDVHDYVKQTKDEIDMRLKIQGLANRWSLDKMEYPEELGEF